MSIIKRARKVQKSIRQVFNPSCILLAATIVFMVFLTAVGNAAEIKARAAIVIDSSTDEVLYGKNPDKKMPPASTTKLITAMVALDRLSPDDMVTISRKAAETQSIQPKLKSGEKISVQNLLDLALMRSINGAAVALAEAAAGTERSFVVLMNAKAKTLGAANTKFINASGLPGKGQYTTARDLATIMKGALTYDVISDIIDTRVKTLEVDGKTVILTNTNDLLWADEDHLGGKTGYTRAARHCFVGASEKDEGTLIIALLGDSSRDTLWTDAEKLLAKDFKKGTIIIDAREDGLRVKRHKAAHRTKSKRSRAKSL